MQGEKEAGKNPQQIKCLNPSGFRRRKLLKRHNKEAFGYVGEKEDKPHKDVL